VNRDCRAHLLQAAVNRGDVLRHLLHDVPAQQLLQQVGAAQHLAGAPVRIVVESKNVDDAATSVSLHVLPQRFLHKNKNKNSSSPVLQKVLKQLLLRARRLQTHN
jgi:hypothetical protein